MTSLSDDEVRRIAELLRHELSALTVDSYTLSSEERQRHEADHEFIALMRRKVEAEERLVEEKRRRRQQIADRIYGSLVLSATIGLVAMIGYVARMWVLDVTGHSPQRPDQHQTEQR